MADEMMALIADQPRLATMLQFGASMVKSGMFPKHIASAEAALAIILKGRDLGLEPTTALSSMHMISGKVELSASLMQALLQKSGVIIQTLERGPSGARIRATRNLNGSQVTEEYAFTLDDAKKAGLAEKDNWKGYPAAMCYARCISQAARGIGADILHGVYAEGEIMEPVHVEAVVVARESKSARLAEEIKK